MTLDPAGGPDPAHPGAGVHTLVADTGQPLGAVRVDGALGLTLNVRVALEAGITRARGRLIPVGALSIDATGAGATGVNDLWRRGGGGWSVAAGEWVSNVSLVTDAERHVIPDFAVGIDTAEARTRILTLSVDARLVLGALGVDNTLWPAVWRLANHVRQTRAVTRAPQIAGRIGVGAAGVGVTRIFYYHRSNS